VDFDTTIAPPGFGGAPPKKKKYVSALVLLLFTTFWAIIVRFYWRVGLVGKLRPAHFISFTNVSWVAFYNVDKSSFVMHEVLACRVINLEVRTHSRF
jgi:hypothetical protein